MRSLLVSIVDLMMVAAALMVALYLRDELVLTYVRVAFYTPFMLTSVAVAAILLPAFGISKRMWRFTTFSDYSRIALACLAVVVTTVTILSLSGKMTGFARSVPVMQFMFMTSMMVGGRLAARSLRRYQDQVSFGGLPRPALESVLVLGVGPLSEVYLRALPEMTGRDVRIVGVLSERDRHVGRMMFGFPVLGTVDEIDSVIDELAVHAVQIDRIVVTASAAEVPAKMAQTLVRLAERGSLRLEWMGAKLSPAGQGAPASVAAMQPVEPGVTAFVLSPDDLTALETRSYWRIKRMIDVVGAALLLVVLAPVIAVVWALVALEFGQPVMFWQMRPGRGGKPFRLYKFRSMAGARDGQGRRRSDQERMTSIGAFLRRTRMDELPQLVNILMGDMSFVGPRPLIQAEQSAAIAARLLVRPGLTGWAQVKGGRTISVADKAALDIWYARNASLSLDFEIALRTIPMVLFGESVNAVAISDAWSELELAGICRGSAAAAPKRLSTANRLAA